MSWVLILFIHAGVWSKNDSMTITQVSGFTTLQTCEAAGQKAQGITKDTVKEARYQCVEVK